VYAAGEKYHADLDLNLNPTSAFKRNYNPNLHPHRLRTSTHQDVVRALFR
jgi:hypothetical protein